MLAGLYSATANDGDLLKLKERALKHECSFRDLLARLCCCPAAGRMRDRGSERAAPLHSILARVELKLELLVKRPVST